MPGPMIAIFGADMLGLEVAAQLQGRGCALILLGVMIVNGVFGLARRRIAAGLGVKP